jgi:hypothetical protein
VKVVALCVGPNKGAAMCRYLSATGSGGGNLWLKGSTNGCGTQVQCGVASRECDGRVKRMAWKMNRVVGT